MTHDEQLGIIRAACIKANPGIELEAATAALHAGSDAKEWKSHVRPVRLADVLLALQKREAVRDGRRRDVWFNEHSHISSDHIVLYLQDMGTLVWNLRRDELTWQSDECIGFLSDLLASK